MFSPEVIKQMERKAAAEAAAAGQTPFVYYPDDPVEPPFPMPFLGDYVPDGWTPLGDAKMVDSSGFGAPDEPALTAKQFRSWVKQVVGQHPEQTIGWAITTAGQFQVYVQPFAKETS